MVILFVSIIFSGTLQKVTIQPFDFQVEDDPATHVRGLWGLYAQNGNLLFIPKDDPFVLQIDPKTKAVKRIGGPGRGPGELGVGFPWALSISDSSIWVLDNPRSGASFFKEGVFYTSFRVKNYHLYESPRPKYSFAHNDLFVVIPAYPASGSLANVYDYSGQVVQKLGAILPIDPEMLKYNPAVNNTIWRYHKDKWYCLFAYRPTIRIFDHQFELEKEILIIGPEVDIYEARFHKLEEDPMIKSVRPHFTDFQVTKNHIYVMCHGVLYQMDHQGKVLSRTGFYANAEMEEVAGYKFRFHLNHAIVTDSGRVYLGLQGSGYFEHDLWYADVPSLKSK